MTLHKKAASVGIAVGLVTAGWGITAGSAAAMAGTAAPTAGVAASPTAQPVSSQDRMFMADASQINLTEIALGTYIQAHASTATVKDLGAQYARDHAAAQDRLRALASRLHVALPTAPGAQLGSIMSRIEAQKGRHLDVDFVRFSVVGHEAAIALTRKEQGAGSNPQVKAYAAYFLPMLQMHLKMAEHAASALAG
jgi:putative membrane protein